MKIPPEIAVKVERYVEANNEATKLFKEVVEWLNENTDADGVYVESLFIAELPFGTLQNEDEYCDQCSGYCEDDYYGNYYHQIEGSDVFVGYSYTT